MAQVTVIIATHGRPALLARAIRSVKSQSFGDVAVIVVSDVRCEATYQAARGLLSEADLYVERGGAPGPAPSRSLALRLACSEHVMFLDDDDEFAEGFLSGVDPFRRASPGSILFCDFQVVQDGEDRLEAGTTSGRVSIGDRDPLAVYVQNYIPNCCLIYPRAALHHKEFDAALLLNEDWDFLLNAMQAAPLMHVPAAGPVIHKTERSKGDRRGAVNDHLLPDTMMTIYRKWPAPTAALKTARQSLFASVGIRMPLELF